MEMELSADHVIDDPETDNWFQVHCTREGTEYMGEGFAHELSVCSCSSFESQPEVHWSLGTDKSSAHYSGKGSREE